MGSVREEVAKNLLYYRKKGKITQRALAEQLGISHNTVSQWESCKNSIEAELLFKICEIFGVSVNDMYGTFSNAMAEAYTTTEKRLIDEFRALNEEGQEKITEYIKDLTNSGRYIKTDSHGMDIKQKQA